MSLDITHLRIAAIRGRGTQIGALQHSSPPVESNWAVEGADVALGACADSIDWFRSVRSHHGGDCRNSPIPWEVVLSHCGRAILS